MLVSVAACSQRNESAMPPVASGSVVVTPQAPMPTSVKPSIRGFITRINYSAESTEILVEYFAPEDREPEYNYDKALVKLDGNTALATDRDEMLAVSQLSVGSTVEVWFSDTPAESYPALAYGQAVRIITTTSTPCGVNVLPQLSVISGSSAAAVVTDAVWKDQTYEFEPLEKLLDRTYGAHLTVAPGDTVALNFSRTPRNVTAVMSDSPNGKGVPVELDENLRLVVPEDATGDAYIRVSAEYYIGSVDYGFALALIGAGE